MRRSKSRSQRSGFEQRLEIQRSGGHGDFAARIARPLGGLAVHVEFETVAIRIAEIEGLAHAMIGGTIQGT